MDSNNQAEKFNLWQWLTSSPTRMIGLVLLVLAFVMFLTLIVLVSPKAVKKKVVVSTPQSSPTILPSPLPDPTKDWQMISKKDFSLKAPLESKIVYKENYNQASGSAFLQLSLDLQKEATQQGILVLEARDKKSPPLQSIPTDIVSEGEKVNLNQQVYLLNLSAPTTKRVITKPIEILIGGNKGYEFYLESSVIKTNLKDYSVPLGKTRVIEFSTDDKHFIIISPLNPQAETILSTLVVK